MVSAARGEPTSQLALARRLGVDRTVMTYLIDDLVDAELVERHVDPADRRARRIRATKKGEKLLPELDRRLRNVEKRVLDGLSKTDAARFRRLLRIAANALDRSDHVDDLSDIPSEMAGRRKRR